MRPGPSRPCAISKPRPSPRMMFAAGTRTLSKISSPRGRPAHRRTKHGACAHDLRPRCVEGHQHHGLLPVLVGVGRVGLAHHDERSCSARLAAPDVHHLRPLMHVLVAVAHDAATAMLVASLEATVRLGHGEGRADFAVQQRLRASAPSARRVPKLRPAPPCCRCRGREQLNTSGANEMRPMASASGAYSRLVSPAPCSASGRNRFQRPSARALDFRSSRMGGR